MTPAMLLALLNGENLLDATPAGIVASEARGQRELVNSTNLPIEGPWEELEALGFKRGENVDELFCTATLPEGWRKEPTHHNMWSKIVDAEGVERVSVFYKAASYDRRAFMRISRAAE